jgi:hypothetical protein
MESSDTDDTIIYENSKQVRFVCNTCDKVYQNQCSLNRHVKENHKKKQVTYACSICQKRYVRRNDVSRHAKRRHPQKNVWAQEKPTTHTRNHNQDNSDTMEDQHRLTNRQEDYRRQDRARNHTDRSSSRRDEHARHHRRQTSRSPASRKQHTDRHKLQDLHHRRGREEHNKCDCKSFHSPSSPQSRNKGPSRTHHISTPTKSRADSKLPKKRHCTTTPPPKQQKRRTGKPAIHDTHITRGIDTISTERGKGEPREPPTREMLSNKGEPIKHATIEPIIDSISSSIPKPTPPLLHSPSLSEIIASYGLEPNLSTPPTPNLEEPKQP